MVSSQLLTPADVPLVVVSNRGPVALRRQPDGSTERVKQAGGLATSLIAALDNVDSTWIATAPRGLSEDEIAKLDGPLGNCNVIHQRISDDDYRKFYDIISSGTLWFLHHNLFDLARRPRIDKHWWEAWFRFCAVNEAFAKTIAQVALPNAVVLVHDYHLALVAKPLRELRSDLRLVHFVHTPFVGRDVITTLPRTVVTRLLESMASFHACGFHAQPWVDSFAQCCGASVWKTPRTFVSSPNPSEEILKKQRASDGVNNEIENIRTVANGRKIIARIDRLELSKNLLRGFLSYEEMLVNYPRWKEKVTFFAHFYQSRENLAEYKSYRSEVQGLIDLINSRHSTESWKPIELTIDDNFNRSIALYTLYDTLLVNPIRDGMNLVAKEGALVNENSGTIVLSREAGVWIELAEGAIGINPYDIQGTSDALLHSLEMSDYEREVRADMVRKASRKRTPKDWLSDQINSVIAGYS